MVDGDRSAAAGEVTGGCAAHETLMNQSEPPVAPFVADPQPMESAPIDGTEIEVLFDDKWFVVHWSRRADDGSPYGCEGWADDTGMVMLDLESWRELENPGFVDEDAIDQARVEQFERDAEAQRKGLARARRRPRRTKAQMAAARAQAAAAPAQQAVAIASFMAGFRF